MGSLKKKIVLSLLIALSHFIQISKAQDIKSEEDLINHASKLFKEESYEEAFSLYSQLLSLYPKDPGYNFRFGVCMLNSTEDKEKPLPYIEYAVNKKLDEKEVYFFLGKAYRLNFRFDDAIRAYNEFKKAAPKSLQAELHVDREIEACRNGKKLMKNFMDIEVTDKKVLADREFFRAYNLSSIGGKLLLKPDEFKSSMDRKKKERSFVYLPPSNDIIYYSSYGEKGEHGRDIYIIKKLPSGKWSKPQPLSSAINTDFDEDYPFLHPNGKTLYFASKGHNSMGGYDLFKSILNENDNTWGQAENLGFPINTPDDDILFVTDSAEKTAYFSSTRSTGNGEISVYKINIQQKPVNISVIVGVAKNDSKVLNSTITVKDIESGDEVGTYQANKDNGSYSIKLNNGGKYLFTVKTSGYKTQSDLVQLPQLEAFRPLKQQISYETGSKRLLLKNLFDEVADDSSYLLALDIIKQKAKMDVNASESALAKDTKKESPGDEKAAETANIIPDATLVNSAYNDVQKAEGEAKDLRQKSDKAYYFSQTTGEFAQADLQESAMIDKELSSIKKTEEYKTQKTKSEALKKSGHEKSVQAVIAYKIASEMDTRASAKEKEKRLRLAYARELENSVKAGNSKEAIEKVLAQRTILEDFMKSKGETTSVSETLLVSVDEKDKEVKKAESKSRAIEEEINDLTKELENQKAQADQTKNEQIKGGILEQAADLEADIKEKKNQLLVNNEKVNKIRIEEDSIKNQAAFVNSFPETLNTLALTKPLTEADKAKIVKDMGEVENRNLSENDNTIVSADNKSSSQGTNSLDENKFKQELDLIEKGSGTIAEKESSKASLYKTWEEAISSEISEKRNALAASKDKNKVNAEINALENQRKEKEQNYQNAIATAQKAKQEEGAITANSEKNEDQINSFKAINDAFSDRESKAQQITDPIEKEKTEAKLYNDWSAAIEQQISKENDELAETTDPGKQSSLKNEIKQLKNQSEKKKNQAKENLDLVAKAQETTQPVSPGNDFNSIFVNRESTTAQITDPIEKEKAKAALYNEWSSVIEQEISKRKDELTKTTDPEKQNSLRTEISQLKNQSQEKKNQAKENLDLVAKSKEVTQPVNTGNDFNSVFTSRESKAAQVTDPIEKEKAKAALYNEWSAAIEQEISKKNDELAKTPAPEKQNSLRTEISRLENLSQEKKTLAKESIDLVAKAQEANQPVNTGNDFNSVFADRESKALQISDPFEKEKSKSKIYNEWAIAIDKVVSGKREELTKTKVSSTRKKLESEIAQLEKTSTEKKDLARQSLELAASSEENELAANDNLKAGKANPETNPITSQVYSKPFEEQLKVLETGSGTIENEAGKAKLLSSWSDSLYKSAKKLEDQLPSLSSGQRESTVSQINQLKVLSDQKKQEAALAYQKLDQLKSDEIAKVNSGSGSEIKSGMNDVNAKNETGIHESFVMNESQKISFSSSEAEKINKQADSSYKELAGLTKDLETLKEKSELTKTEKTDIKNKETLLVQKETAAAELLKKSTQLEFAGRSKKINELTNSIKNLSPEDQDKVSVLKKSIEDNLDTAGQMRNLAKAESNPKIKQEKFNKAYLSEIEAIENLQKISEVYAKYSSVAKFEKENSNEIQPRNVTDQLTANSPEKWNYSSPAAAKLNIAADSLSRELEIINAEINKIKDNRNLSESEKLDLNYKQQNAEQKQNELVSLREGSNRKEFEEQKNNLGKLSSSNEKIKPEDQTEISSLISLAENNFKEAEEMSDLAKSGSDLLLKRKEEQKAFKIEMEALENQKKALDIYSNSGLVVNANTSGNSSSGNNPVNDKTNIAVIEDKKIENKLESNLSPRRENEIRTSDEYKKYVSLKSQADSADRIAKNDFKLAEDLKLQSDNETQSYKLSLRDTINLNEEFKKQEQKKLAEQHQLKARIYLSQSDSIAVEARNYEALAATKSLSADSALISLDPQKRQEIIALASKDKSFISPAEAESLKPVDIANANINENKVLSTDIFVKTTVPVYNELKPIPKDPKFPKGLVYKVQIGAFKKPIPQDLFKGIQPVTGETTPSGLVRYTAGLFVAFDNANKAKNEIRQMGYNDAFVVAYLDGKLISNARAREMGIRGEAFAANNNSSETINKGNSETANDVLPGETTNPVNTAGIKSTGLNSLNGLMYTVQVGVYSKKIHKLGIDVSPLYSEETSNGLIRYTSGIFSSVESAASAKNQIIEKGVKDAFVTAYYNGKRIGMGEAKRLQGSGTKFADPSTITPIKEEKAPEKPVITDLIFKIQLGAFKDQVPNDIAEKFIAHSKQGISIYKDENGLTNYNLGEFKTYEEAAEVKKQLTDFPEAFVVAFQSDKKVTIEEARKLLSE